jgi:hypothetical protein
LPVSISSLWNSPYPVSTGSLFMCFCYSHWWIETRDSYIPRGCIQQDVGVVRVIIKVY